MLLNWQNKLAYPNAQGNSSCMNLELYTWRKNAQHQASITHRESTLANENVLLKKELAKAREELAIAKKAATYFAKQLS